MPMSPLKRTTIVLTAAKSSEPLRLVKQAIEQQADLLCLDATLPRAGLPVCTSAATFLPTLCQTFKQCGWQDRALPHIAVILDWESVDRCTPTDLRELLDVAIDAGYILEWRFIPSGSESDRPMLVVHGIHGTHGPSWMELTGCIMSNPQLRPVEWINSRSILSQALPLSEPVSTLEPHCSLCLESEWDDAGKRKHRAGLVWGEDSWESVITASERPLGIAEVLRRIEESASARMRRTEEEWMNRCSALFATARMVPRAAR